MNPPTALFLVAVATATALAGVSARAVNISNTWVLPEEGFPVFYRYFRDRISWYEADAVCQFHHANLVTVDSTSQYDAIRAYLKELDITSNVWIGLQRNSDKPNFTWMDFRPLSADGHWQEAIPKGSEPLCVAMDPAADFRWHALSCGGPAVASFICELPVPSWASGPGGCLLTEIPSLTVLYIPEQSALELTSDCGLDGTKRIACKGNANHDEMIKQLACTITGDDFEERSTKAPVLTSTFPSSSSSTTHQASTTSGIKTTKPWLWTSNTVDTGDYGLPTRHRRETEDTVSPTSMTRSASITKPTTIKPEMESTSRLTQPDGDDLTTQETSREEVFGTATVTTEAKDLGPEEYPSAINQGQLFGIIENGTVFDIIELNETGTEENHKAKDAEIHFTTTQSATVSTNKVEAANTKRAEILYTTIMYNKEPTQEVPPVTNEGLKKFKDLHKQKNVNDLSSKADDKTLSKEVELFPIVGGNSLIKLNRTNRKELPMMEDDENNPDLNLDVDNKLPINEDQSLHETIEIKLHHGHKSNNSTGSVLFVTTKKATKSRKNSQLKATLNTTVAATQIPEVSTTLENNSLSHNTTSQEETQIISSSRKHATDWDGGVIQEDTSESTGEPLEAEPQAQPRPNRQRQLTRPQRKSFYPYFFSRMLG